MRQVETGLTILLCEELDSLMGKNVGFVTNHSAVTSDLTPAVDALLSAGVKISALFGPEHGVRGEVADGEEVASFTDARTGLPAYSLYGPTKKPTEQMLSDLDLLLFDIQDVGVRFYTFLYTMAYSMEACAEQGKPFVVMDRPNPIGGTAVEGPVLDPCFSSFVGLYPIPIRTGMTIGELARLFNEEFGIGVDLRVIPLRGWRRNMWYDQTGLPWVPPSPNMPTLEAATVYPGTCLIEGTNVSEGRGTVAPFQTIGAPWIDGHLLAEHLNRAGLPGVRFRPTYFIPTFSKHAGQACAGVQLHITNRQEFLPVLTGVKIVEIIRQLWPEDFAFRQPSPSGHSFFDLLAGTDRVRLDLEAGRSAEEIAAVWEEGLSAFRSTRERHLLYE